MDTTQILTCSDGRKAGYQCHGIDWQAVTIAPKSVRCSLVAEINGLPVVPKNAEYGEKVAREGMYSAAGLS